MPKDNDERIQGYAVVYKYIVEKLVKYIFVVIYEN